MKALASFVALFLLIFAATPLARASALASPCPSGGDFAALNGVTCSIGDKNFTFGSFSFGSGVVTFTPVDTNPLAPGFIISGLSAANGMNARGTFTLSVNSMGGPIDSFTLSLVNPSLKPIPCCVVGASAGLQNGSVFVAEVDSAQFGLVVNNPTQTITFAPTSTYNLTSTFAVSTASLTPGLGGMASSSFEYTFGQVGARAVPEPGTLALLGTGLLGFVGMVRRRRSA